MSGATPGAGARRLWLVYAVATVAAALVLLAIYVNQYDDFDVGDRLRQTGRFVRRAMAALSFPLGFAAGLAEGPLDAAFGCGDANEPCAVFVDWNLRFAALVAQIVALRWALAWRKAARG